MTRPRVIAWNYGVKDANNHLCTQFMTFYGHKSSKNRVFQFITFYDVILPGINPVYKFLPLTQKNVGTTFKVSQSQRSDDIRLYMPIAIVAKSPGRNWAFNPPLAVSS